MFWDKYTEDSERTGINMLSGVWLVSTWFGYSRLQLVAAHQIKYTKISVKLE